MGGGPVWQRLPANVCQGSERMKEECRGMRLESVPFHLIPKKLRTHFSYCSPAKKFLREVLRSDAHGRASLHFLAVTGHILSIFLRGLKVAQAPRGVCRAVTYHKRRGEKLGGGGRLLLFSLLEMIDRFDVMIDWFDACVMW